MDKKPKTSLELEVKELRARVEKLEALLAEALVRPKEAPKPVHGKEAGDCTGNNSGDFGGSGGVSGQARKDTANTFDRFDGMGRARASDGASLAWNRARAAIRAR